MAAISGNDQLLAAAPIFSSIIDLRKLPDGKVIRKFTGLSDFPQVIRFAPDSNHLVAYSVKEELCVWEVDSGKKIFAQTMKRPMDILIQQNEISVKFHDGSIKEYPISDDSKHTAFNKKFSLKVVK